ncbi:MAG: tyrosinase family protein [Bacteroidota bacterium]
MGKRLETMNSAEKAAEMAAAAPSAESIPKFQLAPKAVEGLLPKSQQIRIALTAKDPLKQPDVKRASEGRILLNVEYALNQIGGDNVYLRSYNGNLVGPTIIAKAGETLKVRLVNNLPPEPESHASDGKVVNGHHNWNTTNLHTHGLHVAPERLPSETEASDNVLLRVKPGERQDYSIHIPEDHEAGAFWYHAHVHGSTSGQVSSGMAGMLIIERDDDHCLDKVPEIAEAKTKVLVLQQVPYTFKDGSNVGTLELEDAKNFGPTEWDKLGRYTTINGQEVPLIVLQPGEVQRWRMVHSGVREPIHLQLVQAPNNPDNPNESEPRGQTRIAFHELAVDGLALGKVKTKDVVALFPGYRSEVLVKAPNQPGSYLLVDHDPAKGGNAVGNKLKFLAKVIVRGADVDMKLPTNQVVAPFRIKSVTDSEITRKGRQLLYGIRLNGVNEVPGKDIFGVRMNQNPWMTYDGDPAGAFVLNLNDVEEFVIGSDNVNADGNPIPVDHPFHIHVNPFEIVEEWVVDNEGKRVRDIPIDPVWRDTLIMEGGHRYRVRTRIEDFVGTFVHHCHILDHEDNGMMQLTRIEDPNNPVIFEEADADSFSKILTSKPTVALFTRGIECSHCREQLDKFAAMKDEFEKAGYQLIGVSPKSEKSSAEYRSIPQLGDSDLDLFEAYDLRSEDGTLLHGIYTFDEKGTILFKETGDTPFMDVKSIVNRIQEVSQKVEIQVRDTATGTDDYVTWAPTSCRIRLREPSSNSLTVVLTNDTEQPAPSGRVFPLDGNLSFAASVNPGETATLPQLTLELPADGSWVNFFIAGEFSATAAKGRASTKDKDAIIEIHEEQAKGPIVGQHALMVRVRKEINALTETEKEEFLKAMADIHFVRNRFERFVEFHRLAAVNTEWRDQAHQGAAFISWHRAFLLEMERELQKTYPHVSLPYWIQVKNQTFDIFHKDFLGESTENSQVIFNADNPLDGWYVKLPRPGSGATPMGFLLRNQADLNKPYRRFPDGEQYKSYSTFKDFAPNIWGFDGSSRISNPNRFSLESNPHNVGHSFVGAWMADCRTSPADPVFWVFHCYHDYYWAKWQCHFDRFDRTGGSSEESYWPKGNFAADSKMPLGHHLEDTLWPWDGTVNWDAGFENVFNARRPDRNTSNFTSGEKFYPFPQAPHDNLWPSQATKPTNVDMIDYLGLSSEVLPHGTCYDNIPYGAKSQGETLVAASESDFALEVFLAENTPKQLREQSVDKILTHAEFDEIPKLKKLISDKDQSLKVQMEAFELLAGVDLDMATEQAAVILNDEKVSDQLSADILKTLSNSMHFEADQPTKMKIMKLLSLAAQSENGPMTKSTAVSSLTNMGSPQAKILLLKFLETPKDAPMPEEEIVRLLGSFADQYPKIRTYLANRNPKVASSAALALTSDIESENQRAAMALNKNNDVSLRLATIQSLIHGENKGGEVLEKIFRDSTEPKSLREAAGSGLRVWIQKGGQLPSTPKSTGPSVLKNEAFTDDENTILSTLEDMVESALSNREEAESK